MQDALALSVRAILHQKMRQDIWLTLKVRTNSTKKYVIAAMLKQDFAIVFTARKHVAFMVRPLVFVGEQPAIFSKRFALFLVVAL